MEIRNQLHLVREKRGIAAAELAARVGVSRQTIYAIEAGAYVPNTVVALKLARELDVRVEELFGLADEPRERELCNVELLPSDEDIRVGQPVELCQVDRRMVATAPEPLPWYLPPADAVLADAGEPGASAASVRVLRDPSQFERRILVAGCDPAISVLARHARAAGLELTVAHRNSSQALELLKQGLVHIAGSHLRDQSSGESNIPAVRRLFPRGSVAAITFAMWEEGLVIAKGNPKEIQGVEDLARTDIRLVNREPGSGSRALLDATLARLGIRRSSVDGYDRLTRGHLPAAWQVRTGEADCCIATGAAARLFGLDFIPLTTERYDLVIRKSHLTLPAIEGLLDTLSRSAFRRELEALGGYDAAGAGNRVL